MIKGILASRNGMAWEQARTDVIGDNLANINTNGYKRGAATGTEFARTLLHRLGELRTAAGDQAAIGHLGQGAALDEIVRQLTQGDVQQTGRDLDVAIIGPGEFTFMTPAGPGYTRNGNFQIDPLGRLSTPEGHLLLVGGTPVGSPGQAVLVQEDGTVLLDGRPAGRLDLRGADASTRLAPRALEASNVDLTTEMTELITALRAFQVNQRALQMQDQTLGKAVNELGNI